MAYYNTMTPPFAGYNYNNYQMQPQMQQVNQNNFIQVNSAQEVEMWPVAPGVSLTFYIATTPPMIATKTKSHNQLEAPVTKYYDLTERNLQPAKAQTAPEYATKEEVSSIWAAIKDINNRMKGATPEVSE